MLIIVWLPQQSPAGTRSRGLVKARRDLLGDEDQPDLPFPEVGSDRLPEVVSDVLGILF